MGQRYVYNVLTFPLWFLIEPTNLIGKRHGSGEYLYKDGSKYIGNWENDMIKGDGTSWYPNGNR